MRSVSEGHAPRWAVGLSALAIVAVCLCGSLSNDGESELEAIYAPQQVVAAPQMAYAPAPMVQQAYAQAPLGYMQQQPVMQPQPQYMQVPAQQLVQQQSPDYPPMRSVTQQAFRAVAAAEKNLPSAKAQKTAVHHLAKKFQGEADDAEVAGETEAGQKIMDEMSKVRSLERRVLAGRRELDADKALPSSHAHHIAESKTEATVDPYSPEAKALAREQAAAVKAESENKDDHHTLKKKVVDFQKTQQWWHKLAETERSPDARFRSMLRELGKADTQGQRALFRRILRMWHALRDKSKKQKWRLDHARARVAKIQASPSKLDALRAELESKYEAKIQKLKLKTEKAMHRQLDKAHNAVQQAQIAARLAAEQATAEANAKVKELEQAVAEQGEEVEAMKNMPPLPPIKDAAPARALIEDHFDTPAAPPTEAYSRMVEPPTEEMVQGPVSDARDDVAAAKVQVLEAKAAEKMEEAEQDAMHEKVMIAAQAADMSTEAAAVPINPVETPVEPVIAPTVDTVAPTPIAVENPAMTETSDVSTVDAAPAAPAAPALSAADAAKADAAKAKAKGSAKAAAKVMEETAKAKAEAEKRRTKVASAEAKGKAKAQTITAKAAVQAKAATEKAVALQVSNDAKKAKAKVQAKAAAKKSKLKAETLKAKAKIKAKLDKAKFKMEAKSAKAKANLDAVKAKAAASLKLKLAEATARAKAADEKKTKNDLEMKQAKLRLTQASADEVARKKARSAKEKTQKAAKTTKLQATLKRRSAKEKTTKTEMKSKTPGALKVKRLARRASRRARELSRKAARSTRRKDREARHELKTQQQHAQSAIKAQARQAMRVLQKRAEAAGLTHAETSALVPEELVRLGHPAGMTAKQSQALKAAYAVGAARRAAKLAWMKVIRKMDQPAAERARVTSPKAPSVAAGTAMRALVQALNPGHTKTTATTTPQETSLLEESNNDLSLPKDRQWSAWAGTPAATVSSKAPLRQKLSNLAKKVKTTEEVEGSGLTFGLELPAGLTNEQAQSKAGEIMTAIEKEAAKKQTVAQHSVHKVERKVQALEDHVNKVAGDRDKREKDLQEENIKVQESNLHRAEVRAVAAKRRADKEKAVEVRQGKKMGEVLIEAAKKHEALVEKEATKEVSTAKKWMKDLLQGKGHNDQWGAQLFAPRTKVISDATYKKQQAALKAAAAKKAGAKKAEETATLLQEKKKAAAAKAAKAKAAKVVAVKTKKIEAAMTNVNKAKVQLAAAVDAEPKDQGLSRYLAVPATADTDAD